LLVGLVTVCRALVFLHLGSSERWILPHTSFSPLVLRLLRWLAYAALIGAAASCWNSSLRAFTSESTHAFCDS
jgi:hypothetical protein